MTLGIETNRIQEVAQGVYSVLLWCPQSGILSEILDPQMPYVLCWDHEVGDFTRVLERAIEIMHGQ